MSEIDALSRKLCQACGAQAIWNAEKQALVCPSCGTVTEFTAAESPIEEHPLLHALQHASDEELGWATEKKSVRGQHCKAISVLDPEKVGTRCNFCGSAQLVAYEDEQRPFRPESLLPFKVGETQVRDILKQWFKKVWFAPNNLARSGLADTLHGIYLPYWTFDAQVDATWTAEAGYHYYTTEEYKDSEGRRQTRQVQHTRWEDARGEISHFFDDDLVPASLGVNGALLTKVQPFPTETLVPYDPSYVTGWTVEQYQLNLSDAAKTSAQQMERELEAMIIRTIPGDTHRNLSVYPHYSAQTFKHILVPVWLVAYTYGAQTFQVVINGVTGAIAGRYPKSWVKIAFAVLAALIVIAIYLAVTQQR